MHFLKPFAATSTKAFLCMQTHSCFIFQLESCIVLELFIASNCALNFYRYQRAAVGGNFLLTAMTLAALYVTARIFFYLSLLRIVYIVFLWMALRPLVLKHFSVQIGQLHDIAIRFMNAIISSGTSVTVPVEVNAPESKKDM